MKECGHCGEKLPARAKLCHQCGKPFETESPDSAIKPFDFDDPDVPTREVEFVEEPSAPAAEEIEQILTPIEAESRARILEVVTGEAKGQKIVVPENASIFIGAASSADVQLPADPFLSRKHARLANNDGGLLIADEGSANGTFIVVMGPRELHKDDHIRLGNTTLVVIE